MLISVGIAIQAVLLGSSLFIVMLRCWTRLYYERKKLSLSEYFAWMGWIFALGWFITSTLSMLIWFVIPRMTQMVSSLVSIIRRNLLAETLYPRLLLVSYTGCIPILENGTIHNLDIPALLYDNINPPQHSDSETDLRQLSVENQLNSAWNSLPNFLTQWGLNFSTDLILFCFPFFILKHLTLRTEQKLGLVGVFSLGAITMSASLARFVVSNAADYQLDYPSDALCMAEMATAVIVVCLPGLKKFIMRSRSTTNTTSQGSNSNQSSSGHFSNMMASKSRTASQGYAEWGIMDDEIELTSHPQKSHLPGELRSVGNLL